MARQHPKAIDTRTKDKCVVAWISPGQTSMFFTTSLTLMIARDMAIERHLSQVLPLHSGVNIAHARNALTLQFLDDWPQADWLLWIDSDMEFQPDTMHMLIESADPVRAPIVGGLCFGEDAESGLFPTIYVFQMTPEGRTASIRLGDYPENTMFEVAATGAAFLLIHRNALEAMRERNFNPTFPFFQELEMDGRPVGEDIAFCARARSTQTDTWPHGIPVFVNTGIKIGHHKSHLLTADKFRLQQARKEWAPPATDRVQVILPTLGRPQLAKRFVDSVRASTSLARITVMADGDSFTAWDSTSADDVWDNGDRQSFAQKVNDALTKSPGDEPWVFIVGDDALFRPGWLDEAIAAAGDDYDVVGTNDLGNPRVLRGDTASHILIRRSYIDKIGASWDGPGILAHEGYGHWYVDDEIVAAAKMRDVWTHSVKSVVEHLHPSWGKADMDETYEKGQITRFTDEALFKERLAAQLGND